MDLHPRAAQYRQFVFGAELSLSSNPLSLIDLLSIFPYYLFILFPNLVFIPELHLLRLARLLKIGRYSESMRTLSNVCGC